MVHSFSPWGISRLVVVATKDWFDHRRLRCALALDTFAERRNGGRLRDHLVNLPSRLRPATLREGTGPIGMGGALALGLTAFATGPMLLERDAVQVDVIKFPIEGILQTLSAPFGVGSPISRPSRSPYGEELSAVDWQFAFRYPWGPPGWDGPVKPGAVQIAILAMSSFGILITLISGRWVASHPVQIVSQSRPMSLRSDRAALAGSFIIVAAAWFLNTNWSSFIWLSIDALRWLQFPSRLYGPFQWVSDLLSDVQYQGVI